MSASGDAPRYSTGIQQPASPAGHRAVAQLPLPGPDYSFSQGITFGKYVLYLQLRNAPARGIESKVYMYIQ